MAANLDVSAENPSSAGPSNSPAGAAPKKRKFRDIANECMVTENGKVFCRISAGSVCKYFQPVSKYECGNFIRHFRGEHPDEAKERGLFNTQKESSTKKPYTPKKHTVPIDRRIITEALVLLVTEHRLPFAALDWKGFRMLLDPLCAATGIRLSQSMLQAQVAKTASHMVEELTNQMKDKPLSLKVDSATKHGRHLFCINAQYTMGEEVVTSTLGMIDVKERQTAKFLKGKIVEMLSKYNIKLDQVVTVTCDNGANMLAAIRELQTEYQKSLLPEESGLNDDTEDESGDDQGAVALTDALEEEISAATINAVRCAAHTIQLAVLDTVKPNDETILKITQVAKNCRKVTYKPVFTTNDVALPPLYSRTRWGGIYVMLENFDANEDFYKSIGTENKELDLTDHWDFIKEYLAAFRPVFICTKKIQSAHVGLSDVYMMWLQVIKEVRKLNENRFSESLCSALARRLNVLKKNIVCKAALLMDPRFNYIGSQIFNEDEKSETRKFIATLYNRIAKIKRLTAGTETISITKPSDEMEEFLLEMFGGSPIEGGEIAEILMTQINNLDAEPHQHHTYNTWQHWMHRKTSHPQLYELAKVVYAIPSSQVSVERAFSALGLVLTDRRTKLSDTSLNNILLIKLNIDLFSRIVPTLCNWEDEGELM